MANTPLQRVRPGQPITAALINQIIDKLNESTVQPSSGVLVRRSGAGTVLSLNGGSGGSGGQGDTKGPFAVLQAGASPTDDGPKATIKINPGTLNSNYPTILGNPINATPFPIIIPSDNGFVSLDVDTLIISMVYPDSDPDYAAPEPGDKIIYLAEIASFQAGTPASGDTPATPTKFKINQLVTGSLMSQVCVPPDPEDPTFYYIWGI